MNSRNRFRGHICQLIWRAHEQCTNNSFGFYPIMWQSTSICFLVSCKTVFDALWVATLFSQCIGIHSFIGYANSSMSSLDTSKARHFFFLFLSNSHVFNPLGEHSNHGRRRDKVMKVTIQEKRGDEVHKLPLLFICH